MKPRRPPEPLPAASDLYLDAFTRWILESKSTGDPAKCAQAKRDKDEALDEMLEMADVEPENRTDRRGPRKAPLWSKLRRAA